MNFSLSKLYEKLTGNRWDTGKQRDDVPVVKSVGLSFEPALKEYAAAFVRQVVQAAQSAGLENTYLPYLYWVVQMGQQKGTWPSSLSKDARKGLSIGASLATRYGYAPDYHKGFVIPEEIDDEQKVDEAVKKLGTWTLTKMTGGLLKAYINTLKSHIPKVQEIKPEIPANKARAYLRVSFEDALRNNPGWWPQGTMMYAVIRDLFY